MPCVCLLPHRDVMALIDGVKEYYPQARKIIAYKRIPMNEFAMQGYFPNFPMFPGALVIEALAQTSGLMMNVERLEKEGVVVDRLEDREYLASLPEIPLSVLAESHIRQVTVATPARLSFCKLRLPCKEQSSGTSKLKHVPTQTLSPPARFCSPTPLTCRQPGPTACSTRAAFALRADADTFDHSREKNMLRTCVVALVLVVCSVTVAAVRAQTPEITVTARSAQELGQVLTSFGQRGEMFGLTGPAAFLDSYGSTIDNQQPLTAALTFTTKTPMFATEFTVHDANAFLAALAKDGVQFDTKSGELTKVGSSLRFYLSQNGNKLRIADNADFLKNVRWPTQETLPSQVAVVAHIDWRNLNPEIRSAVAQQALTNFLPQTNPMSSFSIDALPELISNMAASRVASLFNGSESLTLQFTISQPGVVQVAADVVNRSVAGRPTNASPFTSLTNAQTIASFEWNTPIESELRTLTQAWAAQLVGATKNLFAGMRLVTHRA